MQHAVIYARYSSDLQSKESIADQLRECRKYASSNGYIITKEYIDQGISGASMRQRPNINQMLSDARDKNFEIVITEGIDRLSRSQRDIADIYQNLTFADVKIMSVCEGLISELHIGLKGTMNALFLKDLKQKVKRGQIGRLKNGRQPCGICYGYNIVHGEERGVRSINEEQAEVVRRIYDLYNEGQSPRAIAKALNSDGVPSPRGKQWQASTINGNRKRASGILENPIYVGRRLYNRQSFIKDPQTGKEVARTNPREEWEEHEVPDLAIVTKSQWDKVRARKDQNPSKPSSCRRPVHLISGLLQCEECGGPYTVYKKGKLSCSRRRERGICENNIHVKRTEATERILEALRKHLLDPSYIQVFIDEYQREWAKLAGSNNRNMLKLEKAISVCSNKIDGLVKVIEDGSYSNAILQQLSNRETELAKLYKSLMLIPKNDVLPPPTNLTTRWASVLDDIDGLLIKEDIPHAADLLKGILAKVQVRKTKEREYTLLMDVSVGRGRET